MVFEYSKEQKMAINEKGQNIIVSAGAGSGKTAVLSERIKRIMHDNVDASHLLILTFTEMAAQEMKTRILKRVLEDDIIASRSSEIDGAYITTFDSFTLSIVFE